MPSRIAFTASSDERSISVSSILSKKSPLFFFAKAYEKSAVLTPPT